MAGYYLSAAACSAYTLAGRAALTTSAAGCNHCGACAARSWSGDTASGAAWAVDKSAGTTHVAGAPTTTKECTATATLGCTYGKRRIHIIGTAASSSGSKSYRKAAASPCAKF
jgi:hypothetical protein